MFRKDLHDRLQKIFGFKKVTFQAPSESFEQETLFVQINSPRVKVTGSSIAARVEGTLIVFSQDNKMPYGFMQKRIEEANPDLTRPLFFSEIDIDVATSPARLQNIHERRTNFLFLFKTQYDPNKGQLTELEFTGEGT